MPHTRRKKPSASQNKRLQVTDASGWTHVTTNKHACRVRQPSLNPNSNPSSTGDRNSLEDDVTKEVAEELVPAEAPQKTTLSDLQRQLGLYKQRWAESATWGCVVEGLRRGIPSLLAERGSNSNGNGDGEEEVKDKDEDQGRNGISIVCIGLGSPSGFLRGGWVDRRAVSMYQLAALVSVLEWIGESTSTQNPTTRIKAYAQDPVFNSHDETLLNELKVTVLAHPRAFQEVTSKTLLFCPGAERRHIELLLAHDPAIVVGGPLEDIESDIVKRFLERRESVRLKEFAELETAFWGMRIYFPRSGAEKQEDSNRNQGGVAEG
ncbi:hypothetical protein BDW72DRAFT_106731 [Aspergillus terricola var. indicus]